MIVTVPAAEEVSQETTPAWFQSLKLRIIIAQNLARRRGRNAAPHRQGGASCTLAPLLPQSLHLLDRTCDASVGETGSFLKQRRSSLPRELNLEEKTWCLEQAIAIVKEAGHGGQSSLRDAAIVLQNVYQTLYLLRQTIMEES